MNYEAPTIEQALDAFLSGISCMDEQERLPLLNALGRVLAEDIRAPFSVPSFPKSAMDGYAVCAAEVEGASRENPAVLKVIGERLAGGSVELPFAGALTAVRIMTGAEVPPMYDAVVREEDTDYGEAEVRIFRGVTKYQNYCAVGEDIREGDVVLSAGTRLGRIEIGTLASLGITFVPVKRKLKVAIISTGTELVDPGAVKQDAGTAEPDAGTGDAPSALPPGLIYNSIAYMLEASLIAAGFEADHSIYRDDAGEIEAAVRMAAKAADVVITTGGVSVGKKDLIPGVLESLGADIRFRRARIQPGTPTIGSVYRGTPVLSLSGNPYAAVVNFDIYFWPLAAKMTGCDAFLPVVEEAVLVSPYEKVNAMRRLLRARVEHGQVTLPSKSHASSVLSNLTACNCYLDLPGGRRIKPGDRVTIRRMQNTF